MKNFSDLKKIMLCFFLIFIIQSIVFAQVTVSGTVYGSDTDAPLQDATIELYNDISMFETSTDISGFYSISDVLSGTYTMIVNKAGYSEANEIVFVGNSNLIHNIILNELTYPPRNVWAYHDGMNAYISWDPPDPTEHTTMIETDGILSFEPNKVRNREHIGYNIYLTHEDQMNDPNVWSLVAFNIQETEYIDTSWGALANDRYRFVICSLYTGWMLSSPAFSNIPYYVDDQDLVTISQNTTLEGNYPNPFNPETNITFNISVGSILRIDIYNMKGQKVKTLVNEYKVAGEHNVVWNGTDENGHSVGSGIYFYRMEAEGYVETRKMVLLK